VGEEGELELGGRGICLGYISWFTYVEVEVSFVTGNVEFFGITS
jgi:hypothetical protein